MLVNEDNRAYEFLGTVLPDPARRRCCVHSLRCNYDGLQPRSVPIDANKLKENIVIRCYFHRAARGYPGTHEAISDIAAKNHHIVIAYVYRSANRSAASASSI